MSATRSEALLDVSAGEGDSRFGAGGRVTSMGVDSASSHGMHEVHETVHKGGHVLDHTHHGEVHIPDDELSSTASRIQRAALGFRKFWAFTGPGWLMSIAYLDPGNIESDLQSGVVAGYGLGWVLFWSTVMGCVLQVLAARLGVVSGMHLAEVCREQYAKKTRIALWLCTEVAVLSADVQEVVGSAIALRILFNIPLWVGVVLTGLDTFGVLFIERLGVRKLEAAFAVLIGLLAACFFAVFFISGPDWAGVFKGILIPEVPQGSVEMAVGTLGAVIMPHNVFLHSALVQSREVHRGTKKKIDEAVWYFSLESAISLFFSFLINMAIVAVFAQHFYPSQRTCPSPTVCNSNIGLRNAADALQGALGGETARIIWAVGVLAAGQSATMTGTWAGQFIMQGFLDLEMSAFRRTVLTRSIALIPAVVVAITTKNMFDALNEWLNVVQSVQLPFALLPLLKVTNHSAIMGPYASNFTWRAVGWTFAGVVIVTNFYLVGLQFSQSFTEWYEWAGAVVMALVYLWFCAYLFLLPVGNFAGVEKGTGKLLLDDEHTALADDSDIDDQQPWWEREDAAHNGPVARA